jgi:threonine dehydrogenase-like Zn-dependent dehydrogenase
LEKRGIRIITHQNLGDKKYDVVIEATGSTDGFLLARKCIRPRGKIILKSTYKGDSTVNFSSIVVDEVTLVGSRCGPFEPALMMLAEGKVDPEPLIEGVYSLDQGITAFKQAARPGVLKILIQM